jgi:hypothetical protein
MNHSRPIVTGLMLAICAADCVADPTPQERFDDGRKQFELHCGPNPNDVENPAWHFLCVAKLKGPQAAREALLPVGEEPRVPMKEILALFAGRGDEAAVLEAASQGGGEPLKNQLCYAHLYLGLFAEVTGDSEKAKHHIAQAAGPFRMDHYMGKVAVMCPTPTAVFSTGTRSACPRPTRRPIAAAGACDGRRCRVEHA